MLSQLYFKGMVMLQGLTRYCLSCQKILYIRYWSHFLHGTLAEVAKWNFFQSKCFPWRINEWYEKGSVRKWMYFPATRQVKMWPCFFCFSLRNSRGLAPNCRAQPKYGRNPFSSGGSPFCLQNTNKSWV